MQDYPRLVGDIGGTNARFAIEVKPGVICATTSYANRSFLNLDEAIQTYLSTQDAINMGSKDVKDAAIAVATPILGDRIKMTNSHWSFSIEEVKKALGFQTLLFLNDFTALAMGLPFLSKDAIIQCGEGEAIPYKPIGLLGAGTGLGVSGLVFQGKTPIPLETEGGHATLSAFSEQEVELYLLAKKRYPHVSIERFLSGSGLELIYQLLMESRQKTEKPLKAEEITEKALKGECHWCEEVVAHFCRMLGTAAGNLALTLGARGGVYIGGGIVPRLGELFLNSDFRKRFEEKGRFSSYLSKIPTYVIMDSYAALLGVAKLLEQHLQN